MEKQYFFFYLEIALRKSKDSNIYAFENISHIPTQKLVEIFKIDTKADPQLVEGYFLKKKMYKRNKKFIRENIGQINLDLFEYCLRQYQTSDCNEIRKLYKETTME